MMIDYLRTSSQSQSKILYVDSSTPEVSGSYCLSSLGQVLPCLIAQSLANVRELRQKLRENHTLLPQFELAGILSQPQDYSIEIQIERLLACISLSEFTSNFLFLVYANGQIGAQVSQFLAHLRQRLDQPREKSSIRVFVVSIDDTLDRILEGVPVLTDDTEYRGW
jgi:hypothetical protein